MRGAESKNCESMTSSFQERRHDNAESSSARSVAREAPYFGERHCCRRLLIRLRITIHSALNLPFKQWDTIFPNASCAVALIDRLTHHAEIIAIEGESY